MINDRDIDDLTPADVAQSKRQRRQARNAVSPRNVEPRVAFKDNTKKPMSTCSKVAIGIAVAIALILIIVGIIVAVMLLYPKSTIPTQTGSKINSNNKKHP